MSVREGNREKGWNDPPEFLHDENVALNSQAKKTTILNQRVAHSFDGTVAKPDQQTTLTEPPKFPIITSPPIAPPIRSNETPSANNSSFNNEVQLNELSIEQIESILASKVQYLKENQLANKTCDDILKRIKVFVTNWPKLNDKVKIRMNNLAKALEKSELKTADDIHVNLMLDYPSEVSLWMVGIKKLIHELISLNELKANNSANLNDDNNINIANNNSDNVVNNDSQTGVGNTITI